MAAWTSFDDCDSKAIPKEVDLDQGKFAKKSIFPAFFNHPAKFVKGLLRSPFFAGGD